MKCVAYLRVSTEEQAADGVSLDAQRAKVEGYARLYGLDLAAIEVDAGVSAKSLDRPGLARALGMLDRGEADGLLIAKIDRLSRSVADWNRLIDAYFGERPGKQLWSVADAIDTRTSAGRLVLNVLMSVAQWERETIAERTRDAMAHKRSKGERVGQVPYGKRLDADGVTLLDDDEEQLLLARIRLWSGEGLSCRGIAAKLNVLGVPAKNGGRWSKTTIGRIIRRKA